MTGVAAQSSSKGVFLARVITNKPICREHRHLVLEVDAFPKAEPGQFLQIQCRDASDGYSSGGAYIRRPFSIGGLRRRGDRCEIDIVYRVLGVGTSWLAGLQPGEAVSILGPLGQPFRLLDDRPMAYLVGGGVGLPPLVWLAETLHKARKQTVAFCGARTAGLLPLTCETNPPQHSDHPTLAAREFTQFDTPVVLATDDGSLGAAGMVPDIFAQYLRHRADAVRSVVVYTCGPDLMMRAVTQICRERSIPCQVCLERMMACGMATCQSCVVRVRDDTADDGWRYRLCCTDGPVFDADQIIWES